MSRRLMPCCALAILAASCSTQSKQPGKPTVEKKSSQFDGTTEALQKMRIPEIPPNQKFEGFQPQKQKQKEKLK